MSTILVTGADGFIAPHIIRRLRSRSDSRIVAVGRRSNGEALQPGVARAVADLADPVQTLALLRELHPDVVIHAAGMRSVSEADEWRNNADLARTMMDALGEAAPDAHLILFGSAAEYGLRADAAPIAETSPCQPVGSYGRAKCAATEDALDRARRGKLKVVILRPFNVVGRAMPAALAPGAFLAQIRLQRDRRDAYRVKMGPRHHVRDFVAVDDLVSVVERTVQRRIHGEIINVCTGEGRTLDNLLTRMAALAGASVVFEDGGVSTPETTNFSVGDCSKSRRLLDFAPSGDLDATLGDMWRHATTAKETQA